jgi:PAS domain S-box-containing protein
MKDEGKTKEQLLIEIAESHGRNAELQALNDERSDAVEKLNACKEQFKRVFDNAAFGLAETGLDGRFQRVNSFMCRMVGYSEEELLNKTFLDITHPEDRARGADHLRRMLDGEISFAWTEKRYVHKDGRIVWGVLNCSLVQEPDGSPNHILAHIQDITPQKQAMEDLKASEEKYRSLYGLTRLISDNVPDLIWAKDMDDKFIFVNQAMCLKLLGCTSPEEAVGKTDMYFARRERDAGRRHTFGEICVDSDLVTKERKAPGRFLEDGMVRGKYLALDVHKAPLLSEAGEMIGTVGCGRDVTRERETEEALRRSEARYRAIVEDQTELISRFSPDRKLLFVNDAYCRYFGETPEELIGRDFWHHMEPGDRTMVVELLRSLDVSKPVGSIEHRVISASGEVRWQQWTDRAIFDGQEKLVEYQAVGRDITQQKRVEAALRDSEKRFREMLEGVKLLAVMLDDNGNITFCNSHLLGLTGWRREEVLGKNWFDIFLPPEVKAGLAALFQEKVGDGCFPHYYENDILTRQGERRTIAWNNSVLRDADGNVIGGTSIGEDITDRRRLEMQLRQAQKMEAIGTLAGGIAHDFNNILAAIIGYTEMVMMEVSEFSPLRRDLQQVLKAGHRARDLIKQILIFSRMESEQEKLPVQLSLIVKEAVKWIRATLPTTIEIRQNIEDDSGLGVALADPTQIHQVLVNLCTNAAHAMREKGGALSIRLSTVTFEEEARLRPPDLEPGSFLRLTVEDTGHGMATSTLDRIFDPYFTTKKTGEGSGLGLAIVHGIVKRHGGTITAHSEPGKGTVFHVYFPRIEKSRCAPENAQNEPIPGGTERILFVDDERALVAMSEKMLQRLGYHVLAKTSSIEALEAFRAQPDGFDVVITDYTMPKMTGLDLAREVMRIRPDVPVILCTGFTEKVIADEAVKAGISEFALKPLNLREIASLVRRVLEKKGAGS